MEEGEKRRKGRKEGRMEGGEGMKRRYEIPIEREKEGVRLFARRYRSAIY